MSNPPNLDFGSPTIFFDSHPEEQESYLYSYWSSLKAQLKIAYTGKVPKFLSPGQLRIIWYTPDGSEGMKDYELHEYKIVRDNFDSLLNLKDEKGSHAVRRVVIMGYSGQNPYVLGAGGRNPWQDKFGREVRRMEKEGREAKAAQEKMGHSEREKKRRQDDSREGRTGKLVDIDGVLEDYDRAEEEKMRELREKHWKESDGLLTGEMV